MTEEFLHYIWMYRMFDFSNLNFQGDDLKIISPGELNVNAGPDFTNAKIKIGSTTWGGNIEIHIKSSDWFLHGHEQSKNFDNIILHVVYEQDMEIKRKNNELIPFIELKNRINTNTYGYYQSLLNSELRIPCQNQINEINPVVLTGWYEYLVVERLEKKITPIKNSLIQNKNNWEQTFYHHISRNFGLKLNAEPFELLAKSLPLSYLVKHKNNLFQLEALLFGQAGMLDQNFKDEYPSLLKKEYLFLKQKFSLIPIDKHLWKFLRLRPNNFPTVRIAQFAKLIHQSNGLFSKIIEHKNIKDIETLFELGVSDYWLDHYVFDKPSEKVTKTIGKETFNLFLINTIVPFLFLYGAEKDNHSLKEKAFELLENTLPEYNSIINKWKETGIRINSAFDSQALIELKNYFCTYKKCLTCRIGNELLKRINTC